MENMNKDNKKNAILLVAAGVIVILIIVFACISFFGGTESDNKGKENKKGTTALVTNPETVKITGEKTNVLSNETCNSKSIKNQFTLTIVDGLVQVNNLNTMENFVIKKIANASSLIELNYEKNCDNKMYIVLTTEGEIFYTNDDITRIKDLKDIENSFIYLQSELRYTELSIGESEGNVDLYGKTATGNLYKIDLR